MIHYDFKRGTHVFAILKNGKTIDGKYLETKSKSISLENEEIPIKNVRSITIYKNKAQKQINIRP